MALGISYPGLTKARRANRSGISVVPDAPAVDTLSIAKFPWHAGHDYELSKLPHTFYYLSNTYRRWATEHRPIPSSIRWVADLNSVKTDVAILHLDQWSYQEPAKRFLFERLKRSYSGPKIVINHGCNMLDGCSSSKMKEMVDGCHVVCNSQTALELWDLPQSRFIRHGFSPEEWPKTDYSKNRILAVMSAKTRHPLCLNADGLAQARESVAITVLGDDVHCKSFDEYRGLLSTSSVFFNPSYASANPRARTEAMLCGLVVVTTNSHGEDEYIENGVNGFCSDDMGELIDFMKYLQDNPRQAKEIGMRGRSTAQEIFNIELFCQQWNELLNEVVQ
jgi:hypothetical protein